MTRALPVGYGTLLKTENAPDPDPYSLDGTKIALHHAAGAQDANGNFVDNEGIRIDKIIDTLEAQPDSTIPADVKRNWDLVET